MVVLNNFTHDARVHKEAKTLASAGYDVTVFALWQEGLEKYEKRSGYHIKRLQVYARHKQGGLLTPLLKYISFVVQMWKQTARQSIQAYHAHDEKPLPLTWLLARRDKASLIYDAHEFETGRHFDNSRLSGIYHRMWAWPERLFIRKADAVITVSKSIAGQLSLLYRISQPTVIMNCPEKQVVQKPISLHRKLGIPSNYKIVMYQGGVTKGRGIEQFLEAIQLLPNVAGIVLGNGPLLTTLRSQVREGKWQHVFLPGRVPLNDLLNYTSAADIGVVLTQNTCLNHYYSLPNKLFEYMQAGIPIVGSDLQEIARIIQEYKVGATVNPDDPKDIANALRYLLDNPKQYAQIKINTISAATIFNWENESIKLLQIYQKLDS